MPRHDRRGRAAPGTNRLNPARATTGGLSTGRTSACPPRGRSPFRAPARGRCSLARACRDRDPCVSRGVREDPPRARETSTHTTASRCIARTTTPARARGSGPSRNSCDSGHDPAAPCSTGQPPSCGARQPALRGAHRARGSSHATPHRRRSLKCHGAQPRVSRSDPVGAGNRALATTAAGVST